MGLNKEIAEYILNDHIARQNSEVLHYLKSINANVTKINRTLTRLIVIGGFSFWVYKNKDTKKMKELKSIISSKFDELKKEFRR